MQLNSRLKYAWRGGWTALFTTLIGCTTPITEYAEQEPALDIRFFVGDLKAEGVVRDWSGKVIRYFNATMRGYTKGDKVILDEFFTYSDGEQQIRQWTFYPEQAGKFKATAPDVPGGAEGELSGNAMYLHYAIDVEMESGSTVTLNAEDELFRVNSSTVLSESVLYKLGVPVASVSLVITRL